MFQINNKSVSLVYKNVWHDTVCKIHFSNRNHAPQSQNLLLCLPYMSHVITCTAADVRPHHNSMLCQHTDYNFCSTLKDSSLPDDCWWNVVLRWRAASWAARCLLWCCWWNWLRCPLRCALRWTCSWCWRWKPSKSNPGMSKPSNALSKSNAKPPGKCPCPLLLKKNESSSSSSLKKLLERKMSWKLALWAVPSNDPSPNWSYCLRLSLSLRTSYAVHTKNNAQQLPATMLSSM